MTKVQGGVFIPANDMEHEKTTKFKTNELYEIDIKLVRNPAFHRKAFAFFNFCFEFWSDGTDFKEHAAQFDVFRKNLTVLAGYYTKLFNIKGELRIEAKSLSFGSMKQEEFEQCYSALVNAALKHIFSGGIDDNTENELMGFFR